MNRIHASGLCIILFLGFTTGIFAQDGSWQAGIYLGMSSHGSDVNSVGRHGQSMMDNNQAAFGLYGAYRLNNHIHAKLHVRHTTLQGDDANLAAKKEYGAEHVRRAFAYKTSLTETALMVQYHLFESSRMHRYRRRTPVWQKINPYVQAGFGLAFVKDDAEHRSWGNVPADRLTDVQLDQEQGSKAGFQLPLELGFSYEASTRWGLNIFYAFRPPISDYLDGISYAANPDKNDAYQFCGIEIYINL